MTDTFQVSIEIQDASLGRMFDRLIAAGEDLSPVMADIAEGWLHRTQDRFDSQTAPDGSEWEPISEEHAHRKRERGQRPQILQMEGTLRDFLHQDSGRDFARISSPPLPYAQILQDGGSPGMAPGPAAIKPRPYLGASADDLVWFGEVLARHIERLAAG